jgi:hypothetical protein
VRDAHASVSIGGSRAIATVASVTTVVTACVGPGLERVLGEPGVQRGVDEASFDVVAAAAVRLAAAAVRCGLRHIRYVGTRAARRNAERPHGK